MRFATRLFSVTAALGLSLIGTAASAQQSPFVPPTDVTMRNVDIYSEGVRMSGTVTTPKDAPANKALPCIVMAHGWGGTAAATFTDAVEFSRTGYLVLSFDYRGWGNSDSRVVLTKPAPKTSGPTRRFTAEVQEVREVVEPISMTIDWQNALHWLQAEPQCDANRIGLWGTSFSGGLVAYVASRDHRVKVVYSQIGAYDARPWGQTPEMYGEATKRARGELALPTARQVYRYKHAGAERTLNGWPMAAQFADYAPVEEIHRMGDTPLMIVMAENEELFDNEDHGMLAFARHSGPNKRLVTLPEITHYGAYGPARQAAHKLAQDWFDKFLKN